MLIVLPPSETKAAGGSGPALSFDSLSFPQLNPVRRVIAADLQALATSHPEASLEVLGISEKLRGEVEANAVISDAPTLPALLRYTGVLYDALDAKDLPERAWSQLAVGSALFGVVMAGDPIPHYRLSGGSKLPRLTVAEGQQPGDEPLGLGTAPTLKSRWGKAITGALEAAQEEHALILDLRSGTYQQLGRLPSAVTLRVESVQADGSRKIISHFNKHYKGLFARMLALSGASPATMEELREVASEHGMELEAPQPGARGAKARELTLVVQPGE